MYTRLSKFTNDGLTILRAVDKDTAQESVSVKVVGTPG